MNLYSFFQSKGSSSNLDTTGGPFNTSATSDSRGKEQQHLRFGKFVNFSTAITCSHFLPLTLTEPEAEAYREDVFASDVEYDGAADSEDSECEGELGRLRGSVSDDDDSALSDLRRPPPSAHGIPPLFIHLICSVRTRGRVLRSMAVSNLPTCLGES